LLAAIVLLISLIPALAGAGSAIPEGGPVPVAAPAPVVVAGSM
jgi:hypothetical protein